jgi:hypothetical protein
MQSAQFQLHAQIEDQSVRRPHGHGDARTALRAAPESAVRHSRRSRHGAAAVALVDERILVPPVAAGWYHHLEAVLLARREVLADVVDDEPRRVAVGAEDADVERVPVEGHAHIGPLGRGFSFARLGLHEAVGDRCLAPDALVQPPVERDGRVDRHGREVAPAVRRGQVARLGDGRS